MSIQLIVNTALSPFVQAGTAMVFFWWVWEYVVVKLCPGAAETGLILSKVTLNELWPIGLFAGVWQLVKVMGALSSAVKDAQSG